MFLLSQSMEYGYRIRSVPFFMISVYWNLLNGILFEKIRDDLYILSHSLWHSLRRWHWWCICVNANIFHNFSHAYTYKRDACHVCIFVYPTNHMKYRNAEASNWIELTELGSFLSWLWIFRSFYAQSFQNKSQKVLRRQNGETAKCVPELNAIFRLVFDSPHTLIVLFGIWIINFIFVRLFFLHRFDDTFSFSCFSEMA